MICSYLQPIQFVALPRKVKRLDQIIGVKQQITLIFNIFFNEPFHSLFEFFYFLCFDSILILILVYINEAVLKISLFQSQNEGQFCKFKIQWT